VTRNSSPAISLPADPFSPDEILLARVRAVARYSPSQLRVHGEYLDEALDQVRPKSIRLGETATPTQSRESNLTTSDVTIEKKAASPCAAGKPSEPVQCVFRPATPEQNDALKTLKKLSEPFEVGDFADAHECSRKAAARWLAFFLAKGVIVRGDARRGHFFAKAKGE